MELDITTIALLASSGVVVGFINTLGAGATVISMVLYMAMGMPIIEAAGTNRVSVILQNLTASLSFRSQNLLDLRQSVRLTIPVVVGVLIGTQVAIEISEEVFTSLFVGGLFLMAAMLVIKPSSWRRKVKASSSRADIKPYHYLMLFGAGLYGGSVYVGLGYFLISVFVLALGMDVVRANALKGFMAFTITPFSLLIFAINGHVNYSFGVIHAVGNIIGAYIAAKYAVRLGTKFIHYLLIVLVVLSILYTLGVIDIGNLN